ncbi:hypothetical protein [Paracoccus denitrificans]|jgi:hypothetical protein|uniref:Uncharacterized protein n=1 Tax=Paracoccus denitrificans (strain Pd 1222) TaxID=318586 RepID=A1B260_PARDP|nr:hypothetical protein [Paracoccus denitrificans]ABL69604.1 hypothetical protein Pden_1504 [Paracoccus denitrificans PD1222]MBB4626853.1 hypothetical protein [Paracoccus denitrificans]MCU7427664.1 hypothetical protein [Paracoccus denitrificans]QAR24928.1 hypothetical protein EO213_00495 [Paracoccus denitrificans]UPV93897.1 hypothetical protein M0K93_08350 [Paracoccus denitrificans]
MRFLLVFYSSATHEWRILDTASLPVSCLSGLPRVLQHEQDVMLRWLLGCYEVLELTTPPVTEGDSDFVGEYAEVYSLATQVSMVPTDGEYRGPWLEILRETQSPAATLRLRKACVACSDAGLRLLNLRVKRPFDVSNDACRATAARLTDWQNLKVAQDRRFACARDNPKALTDWTDKA